jgi:Zn-dependent M28 family amino/carboxypeptidase
MASVSKLELAGWVERLSVPRHHIREAAENERTALWIAAKLQQWGYQVELQGRLRNVVAIPPNVSGPLTLVGSHYDTVAGCPGADDNASAVAAMLGCAKACATDEFPAVGFVSFNCEEDGLLGSRDFVRSLGSTSRLEISQVHVLEMVGYASDEPGSQKIPPGLPVRISDAGNFLGVLANKTSHKMLDHVLEAASTYLPEFSVIGLRVTLGLERYFPVLLRSDHAPFWEQGIPATMWTDTSEFRNPHYHQRSDTPNTLNYEFLTAVTKLMTACVLHEKNGVDDE